MPPLNCCGLFAGHPNPSLVNVHLGSGVFNRPVFQKVGYFDEGLNYSEDHDWFLRARELGIHSTIMEQITLYHRVHNQSMTAKTEGFGSQFTRVLKNSIQRRRMTSKSLDLSLPKMSTFRDKTDQQ
jgi:GT2 family glycosyltransferase